jgi:multidrug resistance efflux pump
MTRFESPTDPRTLNKVTALANDRTEPAEDYDALWRQFASAGSLDVYCAKWLALQCRTIRGVAGGVVLVAPEENKAFSPAAFWPDKSQDLKHLAEVAERALVEKRGLVLKRAAGGAEPGSRPRYDIAYPIQAGGRTYGVVVLDVDARPEEEIREVVRQLQWGSSWMEVLFYRGQSSKSSQDRLDVVVSMLAVLVAEETFRGAATALVTSLATRLECDRVSVGFRRRGSIRVEALSHSAQFGKDTSLIRAIGVAMDETADQDATIIYPENQAGRSLVTRGHAELARLYGNSSICSIPLKARADVVGVITFERASQPFDPDTVAVCESIGVLAGPVLEVHRRDDRWLIRKIAESVRTQIGNLIGPRFVAMKLAVLGIIAVVLFFVYAMGTYRVTAKTVIEPSARQAMVAAFDGYIRTAPFRAGDVVRKGQTLAGLDDRELKLERGKWQSQREQSVKQYYEALGNRNAADVQILTAQIEQAKQQVALLDEQISRTQIAAPFDGVIVTGDLSQSIGSPVQRGQVLFELAPLDSYRIILQVDERQIADVAVGQRGRLVLSGFADDPVDFSVGRLTPVSVSNEGRNFFRVEATLQNVPERLRPGMEGVGKIEVDRRRLIWIWTHEVVDWLRLKIWNWQP